jgi:ribosomal protein S1
MAELVLEPSVELEQEVMAAVLAMDQQDRMVELDHRELMEEPTEDQTTLQLVGLSATVTNSNMLASTQPTQ